MTSDQRDRGADALTPGLQGFSQFVTRVLDQLSLSSWLPATLLVGAATLLAEVHSQDEIDLAAAISSLTGASWGLLVVMVFELVAASMLLQAFELGAIRLLEGYWPPAASSLGITGGMVRVQMWRRRRSRDRITRQRKRAFRGAREKMLDIEEDPLLVNFHKKIVFGEQVGEAAPEIQQAALDNPWEVFADPYALRAVEAAERSGKNFPSPHRLMPTRLGNALRAGEDEIQNNVGGPLRTFVIRNWHLLPVDIRDLHDQYRNRLDLYCTLVFVCGLLATAGAFTLLPQNSHHAFGFAWIAGFAACGWVAYRAAITSAEGYVGALKAIDAVVGERRNPAPGT